MIEVLVSNSVIAVRGSQTVMLLIRECSIIVTSAVSPKPHAAQFCPIHLQQHSNHFHSGRGVDIEYVVVAVVQGNRRRGEVEEVSEAGVPACLGSLWYLLQHSV